MLSFKTLFFFRAAETRSINFGRQIVSKGYERAIKIFEKLCFQYRKGAKQDKMCAQSGQCALQKSRKKVNIIYKEKVFKGYKLTALFLSKPRQEN
jgi:hypothetical protein